MRSVTLVIFSCKRADRLIEMVRSLDACCLDKERIQRIVVSDDNSSHEQLGQILAAIKATSLGDRPLVLRHRINERGLTCTWAGGWKDVATPFVLTMEEDWIFTRPGRYIEYAQAVMDADIDIAQVAFSYCAPGSRYLPYAAQVDLCQAGDLRYLRWPDVHHWPGYTNNPSVVHMDRVRNRMEFPYPVCQQGAEFNFAQRFKSAGLCVAFMPLSVTEHTGTSVRAFALNQTRE